MHGESTRKRRWLTPVLGALALVGTVVLVNIAASAPSARGGAEGSTTWIRLMDTRRNGSTVDSLFLGGGPLLPRRPVELAVTGRATFEPGLSSVTLRLGVTGARQAGAIAVHQCGQPSYSGSSIGLAPSSDADRTVSIELGSTGSVCLTSTVGVHVTVDALSATTPTTSTTSTTSPDPQKEIASVAVGGGHTCIALTTGTVRCVGRNSDGQLGNGTTTGLAANTSFSTVLGLADARAITAGSFFTCALRADTTVACWGANAQGELGNGTTIATTTPTPVTGLTGVTALSASGGHACAIQTGGTVACWGQDYGTTPVPIAGLAGVSRIAAGPGHNCAVLSDTTVRCWGRNIFGELGNGTTDASATPVAVTGLTGVVEIGTGGFTSCAVRLNGTVACWGANTGDGTGQPSVTPVDVPGISTATQIDGGFSVTGGESPMCAITADGAMCWLAQNFAFAGWALQASPSLVVGTAGAIAVSTHNYQACATYSATDVRCWGFNFLGQVGDGTTTDRLTPVAVVGL